MEDQEIECPRCGTVVYQDVTRCPHCGLSFYPVEAEPDEESEPTGGSPLVAVLGGGMAAAAMALFGSQVAVWAGSTSILTLDGKIWVAGMAALGGLFGGYISGVIARPASIGLSLACGMLSGVLGCAGVFVLGLRWYEGAEVLTQGVFWLSGIFQLILGGAGGWGYLWLSRREQDR